MRGHCGAGFSPGRSEDTTVPSFCWSDFFGGFWAGVLTVPENQSRAGRVHSITAANAIIIGSTPPETGEVSTISTASTVKPIRAARWPCRT